MNDLTILDNFYSDPIDFIQNLNGDYPISGCGNGKRSLDLSEINKQIYYDVRSAIFRAHNIDGRGLTFVTYFTEHAYDEIEIFNQRFVHIDGRNPDRLLTSFKEYNIILGGQIYLTPDPDPEAGTKIYSLKPEINWTESEQVDRLVNHYRRPRDLYDSGSIGIEQYKTLHAEYHNNFNLTCDVKNVFNRLVSWKGKTLHSDVVTKNMPKRLSQYFFVMR
jgi:hypothetical protein